ncbi:MAG: hypothetical protein EBQ89_05160, partial [Alphaproteobacteria bacterium]|nr:hypothetical protein [Alphaproteobacteria bacterium]
LWLCRVPEKAPAPEKSPAQAPKTTDKTDKTTEAPSPFDFGGDFAPLVGYTQETIDQKKLGERYTARFAGMTIAQADWQPQRFLQRQMFQDDVLSGKYPKTDLGQLINIFDVE